MAALTCLMLSKLRAKAFWGLDTTKRGQIRDAYRLLKELDRIDSKSEHLSTNSKIALSRLLAHATATTTFYGSFKKEDGNELSHFPIVNKHIIRERQADFLSNSYDKRSLLTMSTCGSTGTPFVCYQNPEKKQRVYAEVIFFNEKAGYEVGNSLIYLRAFMADNRKSKLLQWIQNITLMDITNLDDNCIKNLLVSIQSVSSHGSSVILAYGSTYDALKEYLNENNLVDVSRCKICGLISTAEMLFDETRKVISESFLCRFYSRYANQENGIIGQDSPEYPNIFVLNEAHYLIEILKLETNKAAEEGEVGRIVITDLYNYAMPMIRYDTGDIGGITYIPYNGVQKRAVTNFGGRKTDIVFYPNGTRLSPHKITGVFWSFPEIIQFQFIQQSKNEYTAKVNVAGRFHKENELKALLRDLLGGAAVINIETVTEIPVLSSGKRRYIVNQMAETI